MKRNVLFMALLFVTAFATAQTTLFSENFDSYTAGQTVVSQQPLIYPWTGGSGENAFVSDAQAHSPSNSMKIINDNDMVYSFLGKTSGIYRINFWMYVVSGQGGYFNIEHAFGSSWAFAFYFRTNGTCDLIQGGATTNFAYDMGTWMQIELLINLEEDEATAWVNETEILTWTFSNEEDAPGGQNKLDVINFYGLHMASYGVNNSEYFIDDFEFIEIESGLLPPTVNVSTEQISTNGMAAESLTLGNTGEEPMTYKAYPTFEQNPVSASLANGTLQYYTDIISTVGWQESFEVKAAVRLNTDLTSGAIGQAITYIVFFMGDAPVGGNATVYVWRKGGFDLPGTSEVLFEQVVSPTENSWNGVQLTEPIVITGDEIWIGYKFTTPAGGHSVGTDDQLVVPGTCYLSTGPVWFEFTGIDGVGNFCIHAEVEGLGWPVWLSVAPGQGIVNPAASTTLNLTFNTAGLEPGVYNANVVIGANDPAHQWTEVPVQLNFETAIDNVTRIGVMTYPNPATDVLNIVSDNQIGNVAIYNVAGQAVAVKMVNAERCSIDISTLPAGNYVVEVEVAGTTSRSKLVIE